jgi:hypothetical protein
MHGHQTIKRLFRLTSLAAKLEKFENRFDYKFVVTYEKNNKNMIAQLCDKYGSDKGEIKTFGHPYTWQSMTYADFYLCLFHHCRNRVKRVFECGLGTNNPNLGSSMGVNGKPGASLRVWRDYFPNAFIVGADIDRDILFEDERIQTYYVDQLDADSIRALWGQVGCNDFDFMIDDGLHKYEAGSCLFENSISKLAKDGIYIIEDVEVNDLFRYKDFFSGKDYIVNYVNLYRPYEDSGDNNLIVIRHF